MSDLTDAIEYYMQGDSLEEIKELLQTENPAENNNEAIASAVEFGHIDIVKLLLEDSRVDTTRALRVAARNEKTYDIMKLLLADPRTDPSVNDNVALIAAIKAGDVETVKKLLADDRVDPTANDNWAMRTANENDQHQIVKLLSKDQRVKDSIKNQFPSIYEQSLKFLPDILFVKKVELKEEEKVVPTAKEDIKVIHNNNGYNDVKPNADPLYLDDKNQTPIGYNIHFPPEGVEVKNVMIRVYGGDEKKTRENNAVRPNLLKPIDQYLLEQGTAVITLNLPDLLKLDVYQGNMPEDLFLEIHACIDKFFQTLVNTPEKLANTPETLHDLKELSALKNNIFLYGASFGGLMSISHAALYPNTFTGYISHDGVVDVDMSQKSDTTPGLKTTWAPWLDPATDEKIKKIVDKLMILHSRDDNDVNIKVSLSLYRKLKRLQKSHLARLHISSHANAMLDILGYSYKGHWVPDEKLAFLQYAQTILDFMNHGPDYVKTQKDSENAKTQESNEQKPNAITAMTELQAYRYEKLANQFYKEGTLQQKFISEAFERNRLDPNENKYTKALLSKQHQETTWQEHFEPIYHSMYLLDQMSAKGNEALMSKVIEELNQNNRLSPSVISNTLKFQENIFFQWLDETQKMGFPFNSEDFSHNPHMITHLREMLASLDSKSDNQKKYILTAILLGNPTLITQLPLYASFKNDAGLMEGSLNAKNKLIHSFTKHNELVKRVWQDTAKQTLSMQKAQQKDASLTTSVSQTPKQVEPDAPHKGHKKG